ncbi:MAG: hypothetical protein JWO36_7491 [Myxococcales bacterium]|nr:hypothetical protein [Myxococcales bacterium]
MMIRLLLPLLIAAACNGVKTNATTPDAPPDASQFSDAMEPPISPHDDEGGEVRLEWIHDSAGRNTARATAFFYKQENPAWHMLPAFPGCVDVRARTTWPLAQGAATYVDVGSVFVESQHGSALVLAKDSTGRDGGTATEDFLGRPHDLWWKKLPDFTANDGDTYYPPDALYNVLLAGTNEWPAKVYAGVAYMPASFTPVTPPEDTSFGLPAGPLATTYTRGTNANLPADWGGSYETVFTSPNFVDSKGVELPIVVCRSDLEAGATTVPSAFVDLIRSYATGTLIRQVVVDHIVEFSDGSPRATANRKRLDVLGIRSYTTTWSAI